MNQPVYRVNFEEGAFKRTRLWDPRLPLPLGQPFHSVLEATPSGARVRALRGGPIENLAIGVRSEIALGDRKLSLLVGRTRGLSAPVRASDPPFPELEEDLPDPESRIFARALLQSTVAMGMTIAVALLLRPPSSVAPPEPVAIQLELPALLRKVHQVPLLKPTTRPRGVAQASQASRPLARSALHELAARAVHGGMTRLLLKSDSSLAGTGPSEGARKLLGSRPGALALQAPRAGAIGVESARIAALGGEGDPSGGRSKNVGYGKGDRAQVTGQGKGFVSIDRGHTVVDEGLTKDEVGEVIHRHLSEVRYCYESSMIRSPDIEGKLLMAFTIGGAGEVRGADIRSSTLADPGLNDCVLRKLLTWRFPSTKGGVNVSVSYPFIFKTLGG